MKLAFAILAAAASFIFPNACFAGPAREALENYLGGNVAGQISPGAQLFDMAQVAPAILGPDQWSTLEIRQRHEYEQLMQKLLIENYEKTTGELQKLEFGEEAIQGVEATVVATGTDDIGEKTTCVYKLSAESGSWLLVDFVQDGVSVVMVHRSQQRKILRDSGFDVLLQKIRDRLGKSAS